eukprot:CAMPEP_0116854044 /NCGR_PEP_ID=MMETSP0418-20121206/18339_1 /TAXON_ID=1158023 /ORGANISM="Astrosyne radiata, Strain 13vi08-1A" /LENGTH=48 /DNA_ID= /DNA_START= /DNA_END= /DNA_ORIENTATION=
MTAPNAVAYKEGKKGSDRPCVSTWGTPRHGMSAREICVEIQNRLASVK